MKYYKRIIIFLILATTMPFFLLFFDVRWVFLSTNLELFFVSFASILSRIEGLIGITLFFWQILLGNRFLLGKYISDTVWLNKVHKFLGIYATVLIFAHPLFQMYLFGENLLFLISPEFATEYQIHLSFGRVAYLLFSIIWLSSALFRKVLSYRAWHYIHALTYPLVFLALLHSREIGSTLAQFDALAYLWNGLLVAFLLLVLHRWGWVWSSLGKKKYQITKIESFKGGSKVFTLKPKKKPLNPRMGQYCYISMRAFGEAHPFSVMDYNEKTGDITFGIKELGRFTRKMHKTLSEGDMLLLDGPYGVFTQEGHNDKPKVFIAGGIGITPFFGAIKKYANEDTYLLNCNRSLDEVVYRKELKAILKNNYTDILSDQKINNDPNAVSGLLTKELIKERIPEELLEGAHFFFCGNVGFYKATRKNLIEIGVSKDRIFYEEFSL